MGLIKCTKCGKMFSEHAHHCPSCGYPIEKVYSNTKEQKQQEETNKAQSRTIYQEVTKSEKNKKTQKKIFFLCFISGLIICGVTIYLLFGEKGTSFTNEPIEYSNSATIDLFDSNNTTYVPTSTTGTSSNVQAIDFLYLSHFYFPDFYSTVEKLWDNVKAFEDRNHIELWDNDGNIVVAIKKELDKNGNTTYTKANIYSKAINETYSSSNYLLATIDDGIEQGEGGGYTPGLNSFIKIYKIEDGKHCLWREFSGSKYPYLYNNSEGHDFEEDELIDGIQYGDDLIKIDVDAIINNLNISKYQLGELSINMSPDELQNITEQNEPVSNNFFIKTYDNTYYYEYWYEYSENSISVSLHLLSDIRPSKGSEGDAYMKKTSDILYNKIIEKINHFGKSFSSKREGKEGKIQTTVIDKEKILLMNCYKDKEYSIAIRLFYLDKEELDMLYEEETIEGMLNDYGFDVSELGNYLK